MNTYGKPGRLSGLIRSCGRFTAWYPGVKPVIIERDEFEDEDFSVNTGHAARIIVFDIGIEYDIVAQF